MKTIFTFSFIVLLLVSFTTVAQNEGETAPDFTLSQLGSGQFKLSENKGKVVFIFWLGYDCTFCKSAAPSVNSQIIAEFKNNSNFVAIGIDTWDGSTTGVNAFKSSTGLNINYLLKGGSLANAYNTTYDRLAVIDKNGILIHKGTTGASSDISNAKTAIQSALSVATSVSNLEQNAIALENYPNPFSDQMAIRFNLVKAGSVSLEVYAITGEKVRSLVQQSYPVGQHELRFSRGDLGKGLYLMQMKYDGIRLTRKIIIQ